MIKQFVPSDVCLRCDGCCRFDLSDSPWRPKVGQAENLAAMADSQGSLPTKPVESRHQCVYFNEKDFSCTAYDRRPFECALYPFILSLENGIIKCYVHLACPYVQENQDTERYYRYKDYLIDWFSSKSVGMWLRENKRLLHDYSAHHIELLYLFDVPVAL